MILLITIITILIILAFIFIYGLSSALKNYEVKNKERKFGSAEKYIRINNLLFTENEIKIAKLRAEKNKEDLK